MNVYPKERVTISINQQVLSWIDEKANVYGCSRSWLIEQMLYSMMIHEVRKDENKQNN